MCTPVKSSLWRFLGVVLIGQMIWGCTPDPVPEVFVNTIHVEVTSGANQNTAVAVDFVVVYETALLETMAKLSAGTYFAQKDQLRRDNPQGIQVMDWEVIPGQVVAPREVVFSQPIPLGGIFFANYLSPGDHRIRIGPQTEVKVLLGPDDFSISG